MHLHAPPQIRILREVHIGLDDRHQARLLADRRKARQALRLCLEARLRRQRRRIAQDRRTPLREARAVCAGVAQPREEVVEPLRGGLDGRDGERVRVGVGAHARDDPACAEEGRELEVDERFGVQDDARDVLCVCGQRGLSIVQATLTSRQTLVQTRPPLLPPLPLLFFRPHLLFPLLARRRMQARLDAVWRLVRRVYAHPTRVHESSCGIDQLLCDVRGVMWVQKRRSSSRRPYEPCLACRCESIARCRSRIQILSHCRLFSCAQGKSKRRAYRSS